MRKNRLFFGLGLALGLVILAANQAKSQDISAESAIEILITDFFSAMKAKEIPVIQEAFHPDAVMHTTLAENGFAVLGHANVVDFLTRVGTSQAVLNEEILSVEIRIDGNMAHAWTPYQFYVDGEFSHCGVNSFQFIRTADGWKIVHIIDTRRKEGCD